MTKSLELAIPHWLDTAARSHPHKLALAFGANRWSFSELRQATDIAADVLNRARGDRGGRVGILSSNRPGIVFAVHAATRMNVSFVPMNWRQTADEIAWQIRNADITVLVVDEERAFAAAAIQHGMPVEIVPMAKLENASDSRASERAGVRIDLNHEAAVMYTSGTSGRPKGVRLSHGNLWFSAVASALHLGAHEEDVWLAALPLFHIGGLSILFRSAIGATPVVLHERFEPETTIYGIDNGVSLVSVVPSMLQRLLETRNDTPWPATLRCVLVGGTAAPVALIEECLRRGIPAAPTYGLTEGSSQVTTLLPAQARSKPTSSGLPLPLTEVRIRAANGNSAPGEIGEIEIRGLNLFAGYVGDDDASGRTRDGWFQTGDVGYLDDEGYLYVVDRRDDLIVSGGENISPAEIERVLREHPRVIDAGVIGVPDERWGTRPIAAVIWQGDPATIDSELRRHCGERLARYKIPDRIVPFTELPRSPSGKLLRRVLRESIPLRETDPV